MSGKFRGDRLLKLATFLRTLPKPVFNYGKWLNNPDGKSIQEVLREPECGTQACAGGWMPGAFPRLLKWGDDHGLHDVVVRATGEVQTGHERRAFFGINHEDDEYIFFGHRHDTFGLEASSEGMKETAKQVARRIETLVRRKTKAIAKGAK